MQLNFAVGIFMRPCVRACRPPGSGYPLRGRPWRCRCGHCGYCGPSPFETGVGEKPASPRTPGSNGNRVCIRASLGAASDAAELAEARRQPVRFAFRVGTPLKAADRQPVAPR